jgi:hypothetical protein
VNLTASRGVIKAVDWHLGGTVADDPGAPQQIETQADFGRHLTVLKEHAGLRVLEVGRLSGIPVSTVGDYFSGRHLPTDRQQLIRILQVCGEADPGRIAQWEAALQRVRRLPGRRRGTPYRGLARFETDDARWFFGREDVTQQLVSLAAESSALPLMLVGPSGAGKSSVLRAGVVPRLSELALVAPGIAGPGRMSSCGTRPAASRTRRARSRQARSSTGWPSPPTAVLSRPLTAIARCGSSTRAP